jgi:DNA-binding NarL/FixJ family response regulator
MTQVPHLIIADDHQMFAESLRLLLMSHGFPGIDLCHDGETLLEHLNLALPDLLILDINMPKLNGISVLERLQQSGKIFKILVLSTYGELNVIRMAKEYGAAGYLQKNFSSEKFVQAVKLVLSGQRHFPELQAAVSPTEDNDEFARQFRLTKREREILGLLKVHLTNTQIGEKLFLSVYTVETHRKNIMHKLGLKSPTALMEFIIQHHL